MKNINWNDVREDIRRPVPGGYAARITRVEDNEEKEYLRIEWDFADGEFKDANRECFDAYGFWPLSFVCSYKETARRYFKAFKTAVEESNRNYVFRNDPQSLVGKYIGVVLGEEEYISKKNELRTRCYVAQKRSGRAIREGDFRVPALKKLDPGPPAQGSAPSDPFQPLEDDDENLPF